MSVLAHGVVVSAIAPSPSVVTLKIEAPLDRLKYLMAILYAYEIQGVFFYSIFQALEAVGIQVSNDDLEDFDGCFQSIQS